MVWKSRYPRVTICFVLFSCILVTCAKLTGAKESGFTQPPSLPIIWYAPFFSGGGYCSEAISFVLALHNAGVRIKIVHHGDSFNPEFVSGLPQAESSVLMKLTQTSVDPSDAIVICHSEPGAWHPSRWPTSLCPPANSKFKIGRTMFETDRIPDGWNERLNKMDEVWVPTKFHTATFQAGGTVIPIRVVGEPVDTSFFDPEAVDTLLDLEGGDRASLRETRFLSIFKWSNNCSQPTSSAVRPGSIHLNSGLHIEMSSQPSPSHNTIEPRGHDSGDDVKVHISRRGSITVSGSGSAKKSPSLKSAVGQLRAQAMKQYRLKMDEDRQTSSTPKRTLAPPVHPCTLWCRAQRQFPTFGAGIKGC